MWTGLIIAAGGAAMQADAAKDASKAQTDSTGRAIASQDRQFDLSRSDLTPYRSAGNAAIEKLRLGLGIQPGAGGGVSKSYTGSLVDSRGGAPAPNLELYGSDPAYRKAWDEVDAWHKGQFNTGYTSASNASEIERMVRDKLPETAAPAPAGSGGVFGDSELSRKFTMDDFNEDPVMKASFDFGLSEGEKAVRRMFGARGLSRSGAAVKAATRFATDYTGSKAGESRARFVEDQNNLFAKLSGVAGTGQAATTTTAGLGASTATNVGNLIVGEGNARGASSIAQANAYGGAASTIGNNIMGQYTLDRILNRGGTAGVTPPRPAFSMDSAYENYA